jgi:hypothetical protein
MAGGCGSPRPSHDDHQPQMHPAPSGFQAGRGSNGPRFERAEVRTEHGSSEPGIRTGRGFGRAGDSDGPGIRAERGFERAGDSDGTGARTDRSSGQAGLSRERHLQRLASGFKRTGGGRSIVSSLGQGQARHGRRYAARVRQSRVRRSSPVTCPPPAAGVRARHGERLDDVARYPGCSRRSGSRGRAGGPGLDLHLDPTSDAGRVGRALEEALREAMRSGRLAAGVSLPGSRSLAADLDLSRARWCGGHRPVGTSRLKTPTTIIATPRA